MSEQLLDEGYRQVESCLQNVIFKKQLLIRFGESRISRVLSLGKNLPFLSRTSDSTDTNNERKSVTSGQGQICRHVMLLQSVQRAVLLANVEIFTGPISDQHEAW